MTAEQLKELLGKVTQGERYIDGGEVTSDSLHEMDCVVNCVYGPAENATLIALAPQLARRVIAAEKLVDAAKSILDSYGFTSDGNDGYREVETTHIAAMDHVLTEYEATK